MSAKNISAATCTLRNEPRLWQHDKGEFRRSRGKSNSWEEINEEGQITSRFTQQQLSGRQVILRNNERDITLVLTEEMAGIRGKGQEQFQQLYAGSWVKIADCT
eukprot:CAMPEP_0201495002 /NCGR_PEP_ID=MMETSP0151_2-20130828/51399_1 /ASSEMBLY_ACC=CAM_ASM_000257 /TAXON_ID=200890 /ORGANISM="Paramoeba atlantica, Strain 621/1 / CCAP 1560/9" /LENGTH=103 /DNA_ID=CAMNT_0047883687 /DNA_START=44 /DNA_END=355 /DNA_ORIENTATION=-